MFYCSLFSCKRKSLKQRDLQLSYLNGETNSWITKKDKNGKDNTALWADCLETNKWEDFSVDNYYHPSLEHFHQMNFITWKCLSTDEHYHIIWKIETKFQTLTKFRGEPDNRADHRAMKVRVVALITWLMIEVYFKWVNNYVIQHVYMYVFSLF